MKRARVAYSGAIHEATPSGVVSLPKVPANHRSTQLAQILFVGLIPFVDTDLHVRVV